MMLIINCENIEGAYSMAYAGHKDAVIGAIYPLDSKLGNKLLDAGISRPMAGFLCDAMATHLSKYMDMTWPSLPKGWHIEREDLDKGMERWEEILRQ